MKTSGVYSGMLIEATNHPDEIQRLLEMSVNSGRKPGVIGWVNQDQFELTVPTFVHHPLFKGIRLDWLEDHIDSRQFISLLQSPRQHHGRGGVDPRGISAFVRGSDCRLSRHCLCAKPHGRVICEKTGGWNFFQSQIDRMLLANFRDYRLFHMND
jgi:hypothetical protein